MEFKKIVEDLIDQFSSHCKDTKNIFNLFVSYVYFTFKNQNKLNKNKYKKIQQSILNYIVVHEGEITKKIKNEIKNK